jgi:hypothetical protein
MADEFTGLRRLRRREYLRQYALTRRAELKAEGARRLDVTLKGDALDDYETVKQYLEEFNQLLSTKPFRHPATGLNCIIPPVRLSDTEIIKAALRRAADDIREEAERDRRAKAPRSSPTAARGGGGGGGKSRYR